MLEYSVENVSLPNTSVKYIIFKYNINPEVKINGWKALDSLGEEVMLDRIDSEYVEEHILDYVYWEICK